MVERPDHLHAITLEIELADDVLDARPRGCVLEDSRNHARRDLELARCRVHERELPQVAADAHAHVARLPGEH